MEEADFEGDTAIHEETPLLSKEAGGYPSTSQSSWQILPKRISTAVIESLRWMLSTLTTPGIYLMACLYDEAGNFAPFSQLRKLGTVRFRNRKPESTSRGDSPRVEKLDHGDIHGRRKSIRRTRHITSNSSSSGLSSESESDQERSDLNNELYVSGSNHHTRSKSLEPTDGLAPARRSIRIKLHNEDNIRQRKHRRTQSTNTQSTSSGPISTGEMSAASIKSPTSPSSSLLMTKYPRAPAAPRPLIPERQPSYVLPDPPSGLVIQKTLIIDLDETLIHSMAKGGRMSSGHMVEVKLNTMIGAGGNATLGPQHPILYYVHKRPHCDDFLRKVHLLFNIRLFANQLQVCKWYNLVIFTASVQEYADPVIDWLEQERKFFSGRYYRQHCTFRHGAFIKDLSSVEPDLSKVMILDNSPLSYMFHRGK